MQAPDADTTAATDCTDYSGLGEATPEKGKSLNEALAEVNQQHEWAMEVCRFSTRTEMQEETWELSLPFRTLYNAVLWLTRRQDLSNMGLLICP